LFFPFFSFVPFVYASAAWKSTKPPYKYGVMLPKSPLCSIRVIRFFVHFVFAFPLFLVRAIRKRIGGLEKHQAALQRRGHVSKKRLAFFSCHS